MFLLALLLQVLFLNHAESFSVRRTPLMGWSSWSVYSCSPTEERIKRQTDYIAENLASYGYDVIALDDCWALGNRSESGKIQWDPQAFPSGIPALSSYIHSKGLKFDLYADAGVNTCQHRAGSEGFETIDANTFAEWEIDVLKYDNCFHTGSALDRYTSMGKALVSTGRDIWYMICNWGEEGISGWAHKTAFANSWRTSDDLMPLFPDFLTPLDRNDASWRNAVPGGFNDPDTLALGFVFGDVKSSLSYDESLSYFSLWCLIKAHLIVSIDFVPDMPYDAPPQWLHSILINREAIAINQDELAYQGHRVWSDTVLPVNFNYSSMQVPSGQLEVWAGPLSNNVSLAVILFNRGDSMNSITANFTFLFGWNSAFVRDVNGQRDFGVYSNNITLPVPPHGVQFLKLTPAKIGEGGLFTIDDWKPKEMFIPDNMYTSPRIKVLDRLLPNSIIVSSFKV